jgi:hypothetical protein
LLNISLMTETNSNDRSPLIVPAIHAYYHAPPLWIGTRPTEKEIKTAPESEFIKEVYRTQLTQGIKVRVRRDGLFVFDCSSWEPGKVTEIPGYACMGSQPIPKEVTDAEELAKQRTYKRFQLLTVHLACLGTALNGGLRQDSPPHPSHMLSLFHFEQNDLLQILDGLNAGKSYVYNHLTLFKCEPTYRLPKLFHRIAVSIEDLEESFNILQLILDSSHSDILDLIEIIYKSVYNYTCHQFSESLILSWAVCESLLNKVWSEYIALKRGEPNSAGMLEKTIRINNDRKKRLEGIDFTASIVSEMLELSNSISYELYCKLNNARKARNNWMHSLKDVSMMDAIEAIQTTSDFLFCVTGIRISLQIGLEYPFRISKGDFERAHNIFP